MKLPAIEELLRQAREERAASVKPGSEQERAWHAIVPAMFRRPSPVRAPVLPCPASLSDQTHNANPQ